MKFYHFFSFSFFFFFDLARTDIMVGIQSVFWAQTMKHLCLVFPPSESLQNAYFKDLLTLIRELFKTHFVLKKSCS